MIRFDDLTDVRITRTIIGKPNSFDVSVLFENEIRDFVTDQPITEHDVDNGVVFLEDMGYITVISLMKCGVEGIDVVSLSERLTSSDLYPQKVLQ